MKKRVTLYLNGTTWRQTTGRVILVPKKFVELLQLATQKLTLRTPATRLFNRHGGEVDEIELIQNDDVLFVSCGEDFLDICGARVDLTPMHVPFTSNSNGPNGPNANGISSPKPIRRLRRCSSPALPHVSDDATGAGSDAVVTSVVTTSIETAVELLATVAENGADEKPSTSPPPVVSAPPSVVVSTAAVVAPPRASVGAQSILHDAWVRLNVGGRIFVTTRSTLTHNGNNMLSFMFGNDWNSATDETGAYLIDRSPEYFAPLLNYLRCGRLILDPGVSALNVLEEARFFGLDELEQQLEQLARQDDPDTASFTRKAFASMLLNSNRHSQLRARGLNFEDADLSHLDLSGINFARAKFARADLTGAIMDKCNLQEADLREANLTGASLRGAVMGGANLEGANMRGVNLSSDDIRTNLESANLKNTLLEDAIMSGGSFRCCNFRDSNLANADLGRSDLAGANFEGANLRGANLGKTNLKGCNLRLASFDQRTGL
jgi:uncharacterized protein YjbI with pentapeptide repeats